MTENEALKLMESLQISKDCELIKTLDFKATVIKALEDLQQYKAIGTIEEFKVLKDKRVTKKVKGISLTHESRVGNCPNCNQFVVEKYDKRCPKCRLELDWEGGE